MYNHYNNLMQDFFNISEGIEGSATSFTVIFSDAVSDITCDKATLSVSSCCGGTCRHVFKVSSSSCPPSADIAVTVYATNILGNGTHSEPMIIGKFNDSSMATHYDNFIA